MIKTYSSTLRVEEDLREVMLDLGTENQSEAVRRSIAKEAQRCRKKKRN